MYGRAQIDLRWVGSSDVFERFSWSCFPTAEAYSESLGRHLDHTVQCLAGVSSQYKTTEQNYFCLDLYVLIELIDM